MAKKKIVPRGVVGKGGAKEVVRRRQPKTIQSEAGVVPLTKISARIGDATRGLNLDHVADLAESIHALGLIQPIAVDSDGHVIAGGHRLAAMRVLAAPAGERTSVALDQVGQAEVDRITAKPLERLSHLPDGTGAFNPSRVPVRVYDIKAGDAKAEALAMEVAENEKRRDYSRQEVIGLWERLGAAGYRVTPGKPKKGQKPALPLMRAVIGKSERHIKRMIKQAESKDKVPYVPLSEEVDRKHLRQSAQRYLKRHGEDLDSSTKNAIEIMLAHLIKG